MPGGELNPAGVADVVRPFGVTDRHRRPTPTSGAGTNQQSRVGPLRAEASRQYGGLSYRGRFRTESDVRTRSPLTDTVRWIALTP